MQIYAGSYEDISDAAVIIVTAGAGQKPGKTRLDLVKKNVAIFKSIIPEIAKYNKDGILLVVANAFQNSLTQHAVTFLCQVLSIQAACLKYIISILDYSQ